MRCDPESDGLSGLDSGLSGLSGLSGFQSGLQTVSVRSFLSIVVTPFWFPLDCIGGQIHVVHISHTHPPKEIIQALRKYLLGKKRWEGGMQMTDRQRASFAADQAPTIFVLTNFQRRVVLDEHAKHLTSKIR